MTAENRVGIAIIPDFSSLLGKIFDRAIEVKQGFEMSEFEIWESENKLQAFAKLMDASFNKSKGLQKKSWENVRIFLFVCLWGNF